jgi:hypothetical protein
MDGRAFAFDTREIRAVLDGVPLTHPAIRSWLVHFLEQGFGELYGRREAE